MESVPHSIVSVRVKPLHGEVFLILKQALKIVTLHLQIVPSHLCIAVHPTGVFSQVNPDCPVNRPNVRLLLAEDDGVGEVDTDAILDDSLPNSVGFLHLLDNGTDNPRPPKGVVLSILST